MPHLNYVDSVTWLLPNLKWQFPHAICHVLRPESPLIALGKLTSSRFDLPPVVTGLILRKCKQFKKLYGSNLEYWQLGDYCPGVRG
jgi:hypothetical protein